MNRRKLKRKSVLLALLTGFLVILAAEETRKSNPETGEQLIIPEKEMEQKEKPETVPELPAADTTIRVLLLNRSGGIYHETSVPDREYPGELVTYEEPEGWVIVNEVPLEEYLKRVVPSEMPSHYASEALKAQAICARTYAVWHMREYAYPEYEAHVDDSVSYQVYNQIGQQEASDQAVEATAGTIMVYHKLPVKAYYFSTSCGTTTDENIWEKGDREQTPYISGRRVHDQKRELEFSDEKEFADFISRKHAGDLEIAEPWYRWECEVPLAQIQENVKAWAPLRAERSADGVLIKDGEICRREEDPDIGTVKEAAVLSRNTGGAVQELLLTGTKGTMKIQYEYNIRLFLGIPGMEIRKNDGTKAVGGNLLPSGYFILEEITEEEVLTGYRIRGGGLGHGAGMSQNGARILAEQGKNCEEILQYFYRDISLAVLQET